MKCLSWLYWATAGVVDKHEDKERRKERDKKTEGKKEMNQGLTDDLLGQGLYVCIYLFVYLGEVDLCLSNCDHFGVEERPEGDFEYDVRE